MTDDRIAALEERVTALEERLEQRERVLALLAGDADIDPVTATCPDCRDATLRKRSGLRWSELSCPECDTTWRL